jgi:hypothetical protein
MLCEGFVERISSLVHRSLFRSLFFDFEDAERPNDICSNKKY